MTTKVKGRNGGNRATPSTAFDTRQSTGFDPLTGWFGLAKESRLKRRQKRGWQRRRK